MSEPTGSSEGARPEIPDLTVVVVAGENRPRLRRALESILTQDGATLEVLVVDLSTAGTTPPLEDGRVRILRLPLASTFGKARVVALGEARAPVVAYLEEHCVALPGWARALASAHRGPWACVGSEIHNLNPGVGWSDAVYLMGYSGWMPPARSGVVTTTAAHNSSYKVAALEEVGDRLDELLTAEPILQWRLSERGQSVYLEAASRLAHENETRLQSLRAVWWWNRSFGRIRARAAGWSRVRRIAYLGPSLVIPWYRWARLLTEFVSRRRPVLGLFLRNTPRILILSYAAALGLAVGGVAGSSSDDLRFTERELGSPEER